MLNGIPYPKPDNEHNRAVMYDPRARHIGFPLNAKQRFLFPFPAEFECMNPIELIKHCQSNEKCPILKAEKFGGPGSGDFNHRGRPGLVGGSAARSSARRTTLGSRAGGIGKSPFEKSMIERLGKEEKKAREEQEKKGTSVRIDGNLFTFPAGITYKEKRTLIKAIKEGRLKATKKVNGKIVPVKHATSRIAFALVILRQFNERGSRLNKEVEKLTREMNVKGLTGSEEESIGIILSAIMPGVRSEVEKAELTTSEELKLVQELKKVGKQIKKGELGFLEITTGGQSTEYESPFSIDEETDIRESINDGFVTQVIIDGKVIDIKKGIMTDAQRRKFIKALNNGTLTGITTKVVKTKFPSNITSKEKKELREAIFEGRLKDTKGNIEFGLVILRQFNKMKKELNRAVTEGETTIEELNIQRIVSEILSKNIPKTDRVSIRKLIRQGLGVEAVASGKKPPIIKPSKFARTLSKIKKEVKTFNYEREGFANKTIKDFDELRKRIKEARGTRDDNAIRSLLKMASNLIPGKIIDVMVKGWGISGIGLSGSLLFGAQNKTVLGALEKIVDIIEDGFVDYRESKAMKESKSSKSKFTDIESDTISEIDDNGHGELINEYRNSTVFKNTPAKRLVFWESLLALRDGYL